MDEAEQREVLREVIHDLTNINYPDEMLDRFISKMKSRKWFLVSADGLMKISRDAYSEGEAAVYADLAT